MADLDFDTYFNVTPNPIHPHQQQHQPHHDQAIHPTQQLNISNRFNAPLPVSQQQQQQYYLPQEQQQQQQQQPFEMFDWCFKQQQQQQRPQILNNTSTHHCAPVSTPGVNNQTDSPRPDYFYSTQHLPQHQAQTNSVRSSTSPQFQMQQQMVIKDEVSDYNNNNNHMSHNEQYHPIVTTTTSAPIVSVASIANNATGLSTPMSDTIFPGTPKSHTSIHSTESNSSRSASEPTNTVSPALDIPPPFTSAFAANDHWGKTNDDQGKTIFIFITTNAFLFNNISISYS